MSHAYFTETFPWLAPMGQYFAAIFLIFFMAVSVVALEDREWGKQKMALEDWKFDETYASEVLLKYPHLSEADVTEAFEELRLYFGIYWRNEKKLVAMPSKLVDACWHVFICDTRIYAQFCEAVLGRFLHHEPPNGVELQNTDADARNQGQMLANARAYQGRVMRSAKETREAKDSNLSLAAPVLFSIDERLRITDGFYYSAEFLESLAAFDVKKAEAKLSRADGAADGSGAACGDGGACGCGGSV